MHYGMSYNRLANRPDRLRERPYDERTVARGELMKFENELEYSDHSSSLDLVIINKRKFLH